MKLVELTGDVESAVQRINELKSQSDKIKKQVNALSTEREFSHVDLEKARRIYFRMKLGLMEGGRSRHRAVCG